MTSRAERAWLAFAVVVAYCALATCAPVPLGDGERRVTVRAIGTDVIVPTLDDVVARAGDLRVAIETLATLPTQPALDAAREAWRAARSPWKQCDAFGFGPATDLRLGVAIDQVPIDPAKIEAEIAATTPIDEASVEGLGANAKGFHAIEHVLFAADALAKLGSQARRRDLVVAYAQNLERKVGELRTAWTDDHARQLAEPGAGNAAYPTIKSSIDTVVNESVFLAELVADARLGQPNGTASGGDPRPDLQESGPSDNSIADMADTVRGIQNVYLGSRDGNAIGGIGALVAARSPRTDLEMRAQLATTLAAMAAIPRPFEQALLDRRPEVTAAYEATKELKRILATEIVGVLGATLEFNDNDGD